MPHLVHVQHVHAATVIAVPKVCPLETEAQLEERGGRGEERENRGAVLGGISRLWQRTPLRGVSDAAGRSITQHSPEVCVYDRVKVGRGWAGLPLSPQHWLLLRAAVFIQPGEAQYQLEDSSSPTLCGHTAALFISCIFIWDNRNLHSSCLSYLSWRFLLVNHQSLNSWNLGGKKSPHIYLEFKFSSIYCLSPLFYRHFQEPLPQEKVKKKKIVGRELIFTVTVPLCLNWY